LSVKNQTRWLSTRRESNVHLTLLDLVHIPIGGNREEVTILILRWAVKRHGDLEELFEVRWLSRNHFKCFLIYF
jgi:hypothetical protein